MTRSIGTASFVYLAATLGLTDAKQDKESLEKEMTPKELEKGSAKATRSASEHRPPLVLRGKTL
jgi:hypothetical protein